MTITIQSNKATLIGAKNPIYAKEDLSEISLEAKFSHYEGLGITENDGYCHFLATANDIEQHGREIYQAALDGEYGTIADFPIPDGE
tara:strand:- start:79 stop:339 length:261 start_codon:yes stop_codon:yes gene_type:complete